MSPANLIFCITIDSFIASFEYDIGRNVACDGKFLYITNSNGCGLIKVGSGLHGTLRYDNRYSHSDSGINNVLSFNRGFTYSKNTELVQGRIAWGGGMLLHRPSEFDREATMFARMIDQHTLQVWFKSYSLLA